MSKRIQGEEYLTTGEAAKLLGVSPRMIQSLIHRGHLSCKIYTVKRYLVPRSEIEKRAREGGLPPGRPRKRPPKED